MKQAILLAGGKGERLRPLTQDKPKCMVSVLGKPLLAHLLHWLKASGISQVSVACGYRHEVIEDYFGSGSKLGINISYIVEEQPLGRGGALKHAMKSLPWQDEPVLAINADALTNLNINELLAFHRAQKGLATIVSVPLKSAYGIIDVAEDGNVFGFREKPELPFWINAGIYLFEPAIIDLLPDLGDHEDTTFPQLSQTGSLKAYRTKAFWQSVDTVKDLGELREEMEKYFVNSFFGEQVGV